MPMESLIARKVREATELATVRGHRLGAWGFHAGQAANRCERDGCDCRVLVSPGDANEMLGAALAFGCKEGGNAALEAPQPQPSGPESIETPVRASASFNAAGDLEIDLSGIPANADGSIPLNDAALTAVRDALPSFGRKRAAAGVA